MQLVGRQFDIASGRSGLPSHEVDYYRKQFKAAGFDLPELNVKQVIRDSVGRHRELVGTALKARIENLITIKTGNGCGCQNLATQMDVWGIAGCEQRRDEIVNHLVGNREMLANALRSEGGWNTWAIVPRWMAIGAINAIPDAVMREGANWLLNRAIEDVRNQPRPQPVVRATRTPSAKGMARFIGSLKNEQLRLYEENLKQPPPKPDPFTDEPVLHFGAHLWPVRGNWQWHVNLWNQMPRLINGQCFVGIATDAHTDDFETVKAALHPSIICKQFANTKEGENQTFRWLQEVTPQGQNDVLIYCHGKGVRAHTAQSKAVRLWSEAMYQTIIFNHQMLREMMEAGYKNVHSFRTFGTRPLSPKHKWHPSGTFFAVRAKHLSGKPVKPHYGGVEAWCGEHFLASESWCEFYDNSMFTTLYDATESEEVVRPKLIEWNRQQLYGNE